jgi:hypothetical protein
LDFLQEILADKENYALPKGTFYEDGRNLLSLSHWQWASTAKAILTAPAQNHKWTTLAQPSPI